MSYCVLAIDGGGTWALIPVKALIALYGENATGRQVLADFDLAAANSGGSIVLGALLEDYTLGKILTIFDDQTTRESIFSKTGSVGNEIVHELLGIGPKYSAAKKLPALVNALPTRGTQPLTSVTAGIRRAGANADLQVVIVAFDYDRNKATYFRSATSAAPDFGTGMAAAVTLAEAIHASTNAPVNYFDGPAQFDGRRYWDGAITGNNNPVMAGVAEAVVRGAAAGDIVALSLGTGTVALPPAAAGAAPSKLERPVIKQSFKTDLGKLATSVMDDPPDAATFLAHVMTGGATPSRIVRMNPMISPVKDGAGNWAPPGVTLDEFGELANMDMDAIQQTDVELIKKLAAAWIADQAMNQPIRMDGDTLAAELGQDRFSAAVAAWKALLAK